MAALWAAGRALTAAEVQAEVGEGLAYNTVQTILSRLTAKELAHRAARGRAHVYWPSQDEAAAVAARLHTALSGVGDREQALRQFAASLDDDEAKTLREWLAGRPGQDA